MVCIVLLYFLFLYFIFSVNFCLYFIFFNTKIISKLYECYVFSICYVKFIILPKLIYIYLFYISVKLGFTISYQFGNFDSLFFNFLLLFISEVYCDNCEYHCNQCKIFIKDQKYSNEVLIIDGNYNPSGKSLKFSGDVDSFCFYNLVWEESSRLSNIINNYRNRLNPGVYNFMINNPNSNLSWAINQEAYYQSLKVQYIELRDTKHGTRYPW